jgi:hypothetical protein
MSDTRASSRTTYGAREGMPGSLYSRNTLSGAISGRKVKALSGERNSLRGPLT